MRSTSFGWCQIMGQTARELGYDKPYLTELCSQEDNILYCIKYVHKLYFRYTILEDVIAAYNAGKARKNFEGVYVNQEYVDKVLNVYEILTIASIL